MDELDLRPSPWPVHAIIVTIVAAGYGVLAWSAWPEPRPPPTGRLETGLSVLVAIGEGAAAGAIIAMGAMVLAYAGITTAFLAVAPPRLRDPWLVHGVVLVGVVLVIAIAGMR
jgi:hypothetical protein